MSARAESRSSRRTPYGGLVARNPGAAPCGRAAAEPRLFEAHELADAGTRGVFMGRRQDREIRVQAAQHESWLALARRGFALDGIPGAALVPRPAEKSEVVPARARCDAGGDHRRLDDQRARAAHGIEELARVGALLRPAGAQQDARRQVLAQWRFAGLAAIAAPVQTFAGKIDGHRHLRPVGMRVHAHRGSLGRDVGTATGGIAQLIADRVLETQRAKPRVRDGRMFAGEVAGERARRIDVSAPVDGARRLVELRLVAALPAPPPPGKRGWPRATRDRRDRPPRAARKTPRPGHVRAPRPRRRRAAPRRAGRQSLAGSTPRTSAALALPRMQRSIKSWRVYACRFRQRQRLRRSARRAAGRVRMRYLS